MAFDEKLAARIRSVLTGTPDITERRMFGGLTFLCAGHMACGIVGEDLMLRLGETDAEIALDTPHARPMDFTGRPMRGMVYIAPEGFATEPDLADWVQRSLRFVATLPPKT
jgi:TfoX/Sxy family transcriptional regulator of competence genes